MSESTDLPEPLDAVEEVDAVAVPDDAPAAERGLQAVLGRPLAELRAAPTVQAAAVAAGGLVAGVAVVGLARRRPVVSLPARGPRRRLGRRRQSERVEIVASRSLLVDLHLLGSSGRGR
jgi:hypothetical protein